MKALLIVDVQQGMFSGSDQPHEGEAIVARLADLLSRCRDAGVAIFFVQHRGAGANDPLAPDGPGFAFRPELRPLPSEPVIVKSNCSAFQDTALDRMLRAAAIDHLVVGGMQSEFCIDTTVRSAFELGYRITLIEDGHTSFDTPVLSADRIVAHHNLTLGSGFASLARAADVELV